jgi:hypothetical protein
LRLRFENEIARAGGFRGEVLDPTSNRIFTIAGTLFTVVIGLFLNASEVVDEMEMKKMRRLQPGEPQMLSSALAKSPSQVRPSPRLRKSTSASIFLFPFLAITRNMTHTASVVDHSEEIPSTLLYPSFQRMLELADSPPPRQLVSPQSHTVTPSRTSRIGKLEQVFRQLIFSSEKCVYYDAKC